MPHIRISDENYKKLGEYANQERRYRAPQLDLILEEFFTDKVLDPNYCPEHNADKSVCKGFKHKEAI